MTPQLRGYQSKLITDARSQYARGRRAVCAVLPTGGGKSLVIGSIADSIRQRQGRAVIMVHRHELVIQLASALDRFQVPYGFVSPKYGASTQSIQVASVQTLANRIRNGTAPAFDFIIADECQHLRARSWTSVVEHYAQAKLLGLTASPIRLDNKGLGVSQGGHFDAMVLGPTTRELISQGHLCDHRTFLPPSSEALRVQLESVDLIRGDYDPKQIAELMKKTAIIGDAVDTYRSICAHEPAIAFCTDIASAEAAAAGFRNAGFKFECVSGSDTDKERARKLAGLADGTLSGLTSVDLIGEGLDIPRVTCAISLRPTNSLSLWLQQCGRALRPFPGKDKAIILDHASNTWSHGFVDDDRGWTLDGAVQSPKKKRDEVLQAIDRCPTCLRAHRAADRCPFCGHVYALNSKPRDILRIEGELREMDRAEFERARLNKIQERKREEGQAQTYDELLALARSRNYADPSGWAYHRHNARRGRKN